MHKIIHFYYQHKMQIWKTVLIALFIFLIIQITNYYLKTKKEEDYKSSTNNIAKEITAKADVSTLISDKSSVGGESVITSQLEDATTTIDTFITYCNNRELEKAYDMLTEECKQQMYNTIEIFEESYYNNNFNGQSKICTIENWTGDIYKVKINDDILATGNLNNGHAKQDYITIKKVDNEYKLNINNYIGYQEINKEKTQDNIDIKIIGKNIYMDFEEYKIKVSNNTEKTIMLDTKTNMNSLYIEDKNGIRYSSYNHELTNPMLTITSGYYRELTVKFYSTYVSTKQINALVFSDLIMDYEQYQRLINKNLYTDRIEFRIDY